MIGKRIIWDRPVLRSLWLPILWVFLFGLEIGLFVDNNRQNFFIRLFEDLVFIMSFLFYNGRGFTPYLEKPTAQILFAFTLQFLFWWVVGFIFIKLFQVSKKRKRHF